MAGRTLLRLISISPVVMNAASLQGAHPRVSAFHAAAIIFILASLAACASPPVQTDTRCPPLQSYSPASQSAVLSGLRAMVMLESINERDIDVLPLNLRGPIKTLYVAGPEVRLYINHYGALRSQCRALMK